MAENQQNNNQKDIGTPPEKSAATAIQSAEYQMAQELPWQQAEAGIQRKIMGYDASLMLVQVEFNTGAVSTPHAHPHTQATYVVSGKFKVLIGSEERILFAGDGFYIPSQVWHGATCLEAGKLIDSFSPYRADFM